MSTYPGDEQWAMRQPNRAEAPCAKCGHPRSVHYPACFRMPSDGTSRCDCDCDNYCAVEDAPAPAAPCIGTSYPITLPQDVQEGDIIGKPEDAPAAETAAPPAVRMHQRAWDLLRQMRSHLIDEDLIDLHEYAWLAADSPAADPRPGMGSLAPRRLEDYDALRQQLAAAIAERDAAIEDTKDYLQMAKEKDAAQERIEQLRVDLAQARSALEANQRDVATVLKAFDEDVLIRNIARDHEPGWAMRLLPLMGALGRLAQSQPSSAQATTQETPQP